MKADFYVLSLAQKSGTWHLPAASPHPTQLWQMLAPSEGGSQVHATRRGSSPHRGLPALRSVQPAIRLCKMESVETSCAARRLQLSPAVLVSTVPLCPLSKETVKEKLLTIEFVLQSREHEVSAVWKYFSAVDRA